MRWLLLLVVAACSYDATDDALWTGTITRDGAPVSFVGYDPVPQETREFGAALAAMGYLELGGDPVLVEIALHFTDADDLQRQHPEPPPTLNIKPDFMVGESGMGIDYIEQPAATSEDFDLQPLYKVEFSTAQPGSMSGTFSITQTDYLTFLDGNLQVTVTDALRGNATRQLTMAVHWIAH